MGMDLYAEKGKENIWFGRWRSDIGMPSNDNIEYLITEIEKGKNDDIERFLKTIIDICIRKNKDESFKDAFDYLMENLEEKISALQILRTCKELMIEGWKVEVSQ
jgi:Ca2+-binding EF-hand superfamily protein